MNCFLQFMVGVQLVCDYEYSTEHNTVLILRSKQGTAIIMMLYLCIMSF